MQSGFFVFRFEFEDKKWLYSFYERENRKESRVNYACFCTPANYGIETNAVEKDKNFYVKSLVKLWSGN